MAVDFSLLQPVDIGGQMMQGFQTGRAFVKQIQAENALRAFTKNPDDPEAFNALAAFNPQMADHIMRRRDAQLEREAKRQERETMRTLGAQAAGGDVAGASKAALGMGEFDLADKIMKLGPEEGKKAEGFFKAASPMAFDLMQMTNPEDQRAYFEKAKPILLAKGADPNLLNQFDPTDRRLLQIYANGERTVEQLRAEKKINWDPVGEAGLFATNSMGMPVGSQNPAARSAGGASAGNMQSFRDPGYDALEAPLEQKYGLPPGLISRIRTQGEKSNADQVSSAGARTVYQIIPETRDAFLQKHGIDAYSSPEAAAEVAALHLKESIDRGEDPVRGYHGGPDQGRWGPQTSAYAGRVGEYYPTDGAVGGGDEPNYPGVNTLRAPVRVSSRAEVEALPSGTKFIAPDGSVKVKP